MPIWRQELILVTVLHVCWVFGFCFVYGFVSFSFRSVGQARDLGLQCLIISETLLCTSDEGLSKKAYYGGLSYTRQRTSRGFPAKRNKTADGSSTPGPDLHVNTNLMDLGFECAEGEPPAAAAKLRSGNNYFLSEPWFCSCGNFVNLRWEERMASLT